MYGKYHPVESHDKTATFSKLFLDHCIFPSFDNGKIIMDDIITIVLMTENLVPQNPFLKDLQLLLPMRASVLKGLSMCSYHFYSNIQSERF